MPELCTQASRLQHIIRHGRTTEKERHICGSSSLCYHCKEFVKLTIRIFRQSNKTNLIASSIMGDLVNLIRFISVFVLTDWTFETSYFTIRHIEPNSKTFITLFFQIKYAKLTIFLHVMWSINHEYFLQ